MDSLIFYILDPVKAGSEHQLSKDFYDFVQRI